MRYEIVHELQIPKIGFGTWRIGGESGPNPVDDERSVAALGSALDMGYTHFDTAEVYAGGRSEELLGQAIHSAGISRKTLFITSKVSPQNLAYENVLHSCENSLRRLGLDYLDLYLIHWPKVGMNLPETFRALNQLVRAGKVRYLGVSNFNLKQLKQAAALCETHLLTNQVSYSIPDRNCVENGVLAYCQQNDILLTAYSPVCRRNIKSNPAIQAVAQARGVTRQQIALAWLAHQPRVITIPMSFSPQHQAENLQAADLVLSADEMARFG
jgi:diketogulonate reductase-like aldo/keto reductase